MTSRGHSFVYLSASAVNTPNDFHRASGHETLRTPRSEILLFVFVKLYYTEKQDETVPIVDLVLGEIVRF